MVVCMVHLGYMRTLAGLQIGRRSNGTGSGGAYNALLALWRKYIMDAGLNIAAICLYLFHGHLWCLVDYGSSLQIWFIFRGSMFLGGA